MATSERDWTVAEDSLEKPASKATGWLSRTYEYRHRAYSRIWWIRHRKPMKTRAVIMCFNATPELFYIHPTGQDPSWAALSEPNEQTIGPFNDLRTAQVAYVVMYGWE